MINYEDPVIILIVWLGSLFLGYIASRVIFAIYYYVGKFIVSLGDKSV